MRALRHRASPGRALVLAIALPADAARRRRSRSPSPIEQRLPLPARRASRCSWYAKIRNVDGLLRGASGLSAQIAGLSTLVSLRARHALRHRPGARQGPRRPRPIATFLVSPLMLPGLVLGIALLRPSARRAARRLVVAADRACRSSRCPTSCGRCWPAWRCSTSRWSMRRGRSAAPIPSALWRVLVPNILPGFVSGALFAFLASHRQLPGLDLLGRRPDQDPADHSC